MTSSSSSYRKKVYTKFGDKGETSLLYGGRVSKNNPHTEAYGITDEAVSAMGLGRAKSDDPKVKDIPARPATGLVHGRGRTGNRPGQVRTFQGALHAGNARTW